MVKLRLHHILQGRIWKHAVVMRKKFHTKAKIYTIQTNKPYSTMQYLIKEIIIFILK